MDTRAGLLFCEGAVSAMADPWPGSGRLPIAWTPVPREFCKRLTYLFFTVTIQVIQLWSAVASATAFPALGGSAYGMTTAKSGGCRTESKAGAPAPALHMVFHPAAAGPPGLMAT